MPERTVHCHACGRAHAFDGPVPRSAVCEACAAALKCCLTCEHHDPTAYNECREPSAERVVDKDSSNFCDYFSPKPERTAAGDPSGGGARAELDKLFGKK